MAVQFPGSVPASKACKVCLVDKPIEEYGLVAKRPDGHDYICKSCVALKRAAQKQAVGYLTSALRARSPRRAISSRTSPAPARRPRRTTGPTPRSSPPSPPSR